MRLSGWCCSVGCSWWVWCLLVGMMIFLVWVEIYCWLFVLVCGCRLCLWWV